MRHLPVDAYVAMVQNRWVVSGLQCSVKVLHGTLESLSLLLSAMNQSLRIHPLQTRIDSQGLQDN